MSKDNRDSFTDPKMQLILSIQRHDDYITERLFNLDESGTDTGFHKEITRAALAMALLLRRFKLDEKDKKMIELKNNITLKNYDSIDSNYVLDAYPIIHEYLNDTYYHGFHAPMDDSFFDDLDGKEP